MSVEFIPGEAIPLEVMAGFNPLRLSVVRLDLVAEVTASHAKAHQRSALSSRCDSWGRRWYRQLIL